jgi:hypothetical protein
MGRAGVAADEACLHNIPTSKRAPYTAEDTDMMVRHFDCSSKALNVQVSADTADAEYDH